MGYKTVKSVVPVLEAFISLSPALLIYLPLDISSKPRDAAVGRENIQ
jgi:hypothetical protein